MKRLLSISQYRKSTEVENLPVKYALAFGIGIAIGFNTISVNIIAFIYLSILAVTLLKAIQKDIIGFFTWLPFAMYSEILIRKKVIWIPYLTLQYFIIAAFGILFFSMKRGGRYHFRGMPMLLMFVLLEIVNNIYPNKVNTSRAIITNSLAIFMPVIWASYNILTSRQIFRLLTNIKIAGVYLTGIVVVAHLTGGIYYGHQSSSEASNGLAPVQLSGYLGLASILFFFSVMNEEESGQRGMNLVLLGLVTTIMTLTFSRGGFYFIVALVCLYFIYNRTKLNNYLKFLILIPVAAIVYYSVIQTTGGKIIERYNLEGSSGRDKLVKVAFEIFGNNLIIGVGTGNFNLEIVKRNLYGVESGAHNEFARVAAEHGIVGIFLYWGFFLFLFLDILKRRQPQQQYAMYFLMLFCLIVVHNGLKISIQPILLMLAVGISSVVYKPKNALNVSQKYNARAIA